jgi:hypothetical protein
MREVVAMPKPGNPEGEPGFLQPVVNSMNDRPGGRCRSLLAPRGQPTRPTSSTTSPPAKGQARPAREGSRDGACRSGSAIVKEEDTVEEGPDMEWFCRGSRGRD